MSFDIPGLRVRPPLELNKHNPNKTVEGNKASTPASDSATKTRARDTLSLTDELMQFKSLENQVNDLSVIDKHRVPEIQQAIATGSHNINPTKVASKLIAFELGFTNNR